MALSHHATAPIGEAEHSPGTVLFSEDGLYLPSFLQSFEEFYKDRSVEGKNEV
jgi:hypothetical protein